MVSPFRTPTVCPGMGTEVFGVVTPPLLPPPPGRTTVAVPQAARVESSNASAPMRTPLLRRSGLMRTSTSIQAKRSAPPPTPRTACG
ncbi:hypothetical protein G6F50_018177 [Rhizopus delemar]|uniref:Uncharacterized protein n=1 Tax=Rhizopus delemar TaxID=936053 RepID=A0A9P6XMY5_9FUNG|nr:hypothetical protein G6F50_018177 [Rhizopus delemar]